MTQLSGSYSFSNTRNDIITAVYRIIGVTATGQTPTADQFNEASQVLNTMIKAWRGQGVTIELLDWINIPLRQSSYVIGTDGKTYECIRNHTSSTDTQPVTGSSFLAYWRVAIDAVVGVAWADATYYVSIGNYDLDTNIVNVMKAFYRQVPNSPSSVPYDRKMQLLTQEEYFDLSGKTNAGRGVLMYFQRAPQPRIYLYPYPQYADIGITNINLSVQRFNQDILDPADNTDFLQEWEEAIIYNLAVRMFMQYPTEGTLAQLIIKQANDSFALAKAMDVNVVDTQIQANIRGY